MGAGYNTETEISDPSKIIARLSCWPSLPAEGEPVDLVAIVAAAVPSYGTPTGTVTFLDNGASLATATLDSDGTAILQTTSLAFGNHTITAVYGGDANFAGDTANAVTQTVLYATSTTVVSSANPAVYSETVTLTATVTASGGVPTGTVTFFDYGITLGTATVDSSSTATFTSSSLSVGDNFITAVYGGDVNNAASTSDFLDQTVNPAGTATTITSSLNPALFGQAVTLTATVAPVSPASGAVTPTGMVLFFEDGITLGGGTLDSSGQATFTSSSLSVGDHSITAVYAGDGNFVDSESDLLDQTVEPNTSTALILSMNPTVFGEDMTFTATVSAIAPRPARPPPAL